MRTKEINNIDEIVGEISDYQIINDKIIIYTENYEYFLNYSYENENKVFDMYNDYCNNELEKIKEQQENVCYNKRTFTSVLVVDLIILLIAILSSLPFAFALCIPPLVFAVQLIDSLKELKQENKVLNLKKKNILDDFNNKESMLRENEKNYFMEMTEEKLLALAVNEILENDLELEIEKLDDDYLNYDFLDKIDLDDLNQECLDDMLKLFFEEEQPKIKTLNRK